LEGVAATTAKCPHCDEVFSREEYVKYHRRLIHNEDIAGVKILKRDTYKIKTFKRNACRNYKCPLCDTFCTRFEIQSHVESHGEENPWKCDCPEAFPTFKELRKHKQKAHPQKPRKKCNTEVMINHKIPVHQVRHQLRAHKKKSSKNTNANSAI
jgi:uncharacterized Zn-finger protein